MSSHAGLGKLQAPIHDLVIGASKDSDQVFGKSEKDKADVAEWIDKVAQGDVTRAENLNVCLHQFISSFCLGSHQATLQELDAQLTPRTYVVSNYLTAADVALYGALHPTLVRFLFYLLILFSNMA